MSRGKSLRDLLQEAEELKTTIGGEEGLPPVKRNLQQLAEAGQRLLQKTSTGAPEEKTDVKASILLGSRGYDIPKISHKLDTLKSTQPSVPSDPIADTDIKSFLDNERETALLSVIDDTINGTFERANKLSWERLYHDWEDEKDKILSSLLGSENNLELPSHSEVSIDPLTLEGRSSLNAVEMAYSREVYKANEAELRGLSHTLVTEFHNISQSFVDKNIAECWSLLRTLVDLPTLPPKAHQLRETSLQKDLVGQARKFLESQYLQFIKDIVYNSLPQAKLGGVPGTLQLVRSYIALKQLNSYHGQEDVTDPSLPIWPQVFYCMRCGDLEAALKVLTDAKSFTELAGYLQEYLESPVLRLSPSSESRLQLLCKKAIKSCSDPFKKAIYCILARCNVKTEDHTQVIERTEDYMWLKLCQLDTLSDSAHASHSDRLTLPELQKMLLKDYGEDYFNARHNPVLYFQVLLLTSQFEAAIAFLADIDSHRSHAVHFALALHDLDLLHLTDKFNSKLCVLEPTGVHKLNLGRLVVGYTRSFTATDPRDAVEYYYRLRGLKDAHGKNLFLSCVNDLTMESREFELLLGRIHKDGSRKPGYIDKFGNSKATDIIQFIADNANEKGLFEDAVRLYDLAGNHMRVVEVLCHLLGGVVSAAPHPQSNRIRLQTLAIDVAERYHTLSHVSSERLSHTFFMLIDLMRFFDFYHSKDTDNALKVMQQLSLVPLQDSEIEPRVAMFRGGTDDQIRKCYPEILLAVMSILYTKYKELSKTEAGGGYIEHKDTLRGAARTLITFAGMIPYQLSGDVNARLVQMEVLMN